MLGQNGAGAVLPSEAAARDLHTVLAKRSEQALLEVWSDLTRDGISPSKRDTRAAVKRYMGGATSHPPGWHELLGTVGDTLLTAQKQLETFERAVEGEELTAGS